MYQQLRSFSSKLHCHIPEGIIVTCESSSIFKYDISSLINGYIFDRNISIYLQLSIRKFKNFPYRNKLTVLKFNNACGRSHDVHNSLKKIFCTLLRVVRYLVDIIFL
jgi:hypothetical protein